MLKRVDFFGAPGVGKSTLYKELIKQRPKSKPWLTPGEAKIIWAQQYATKNANTKTEILKAFLLKSNIFKKLHPFLAEQVVKPAMANMLWDQKNEYADFIEVALSGAAIKEKEPLRRLLGLAWFFDVFATAVFFSHMLNNQLVFFDESLCQKVFGVLDCKSNLYENITVQYFENIPRPDVFIFCELDQNVLFQRITARSKVIPGHRNLSKDELYEAIRVQQSIADIGKIALIKRGSVLIKLDMRNNVPDNIDIINNRMAAVK